MTSIQSVPSTRDDIIVNVIQSLKRTFYNYAMAYRLDAEDLMQEAVLIMLDTWHKIPQDANPAAYLYVVVKRRLSNLIPQEEAPLSLDAPISETGLTLKDTIPSFHHYGQIDHTHTDYLTRVVHWAIQQLPPEVQFYATETFELTGYQHPRRSKSMNDYVFSVYQRRRNADMKRELKAAFEKNPVIQDLLARQQSKRRSEVSRV